MVNPNIFSMPRPPRADTVFHEFTCPIVVDGKLVAEIDMGADITKTYDGHAAFFDSNSGAGDPGSGMEFEVDAVLFQDLNDDMHRWHFADAYLTENTLFRINEIYTGFRIWPRTTLGHTHDISYYQNL